MESKKLELSATNPPVGESNEATAAQLELAHRQGEAYGAALRAMKQESGMLRTRAGDYEIGCTVEEAEGMYVRERDGFRWSDPGGSNCHLEVAVADAADGRFVPGLSVRADVFTTEGHRVTGAVLPFLWHPFLYHYGHNLEVPAAGKYSVRVVIDAPAFPRHDPVNGRRYAEGVEAIFNDVDFPTGQKPSPSARPRTQPGEATAG